MPERPARRRLNWFSPIPPQRSGIAEYALAALPALAQHADVVVWTDRREWSPGVEQYAAVRQWQGEPWRELNAADATLYHVGNDATFHGWIWEVARRHPGIVVLHEPRLHDLFAIHLIEHCQDERGYVNAVRRCYGDQGAAEAERVLRGEITANALADRCPMTELVLERARGAIVHTQTALAHVASLRRCSIAQLDLPFSPGPPAPARRWDGTLRLIVFGHLGVNRRIEPLLEAIALFPDRERLSLEILGESNQSDLIAERIRTLGLGDSVRLRGFVPEPELDEALDRATLAVNLRYPSMGEASHSQLRIWSRGLASLVTRTGWYAELPEAAVGFVDPLDETADLHRHFRAALDDPGRLQAMGEAGRRQLEARHDPAVYGRDLVEAVDRMMRTPVSILGECSETVARILDRSGLAGPAQAALARRAAEELCRWVSTPSRE